MTRKDYVLIASALKEAARWCDGPKERTGVLQAFVEIKRVLSSDNPAFDGDRFETAVYGRIK